jgi:hypothetical protein
MSLARSIAVLRRLVHGSESAQALRARGEQWRRATAVPEREAFRRAMRELADAPDAVLIGDVAEDGGREALAINVERLMGAHLLIAGSTGGGKTFLQLGLMEPILPRVLRPSGGAFVTVEGKGEFSKLLAERLVPKAVGGLPPEEREAALARVRLVEPFSSDAIPMLDVVQALPGVDDDLHRLDLVQAFEAAADAGLGVRQRTLLAKSLQLLGENHLHLPSLPAVLSSPTILSALAARSSDDVRAYFLARYPHESEETRGGVLARLERILALKASRLALYARSCLDFRTCLSEGLTVVSLAAPFGCLEAQKFWSAVLVARLLRAVFARPNDPAQAPAVILSDEAQDFLQGPHAAEAERALTQARSRRVALWLACQQLAQLDQASPTLAKALHTNCNVQVVLRSSPDDARSMRHILPVTGRRPRPVRSPWEKAGSPFLTHAEEERELLDEISRLPDREGWWWDRRQPWRAVRFRTRDVSLPDREAGSSELRARLLNGRWSMSSEDLERCQQDEMQRLAALASSPATRAPVCDAVEPAPTPRNDDLPNLG